MQVLLTQEFNAGVEQFKKIQEEPDNKSQMIQQLNTL